MRAYLQFSDGNEIELEVRIPDPDDGTFCLSLPEGFSRGRVTLTEEDWIRIVPQEPA